jgi:hypothetical protein
LPRRCNYSGCIPWSRWRRMKTRSWNCLKCKPCSRLTRGFQSGWTSAT